MTYLANLFNFFKIKFTNNFGNSFTIVKDSEKRCQRGYAGLDWVFSLVYQINPVKYKDQAGKSNSQEERAKKKI